MLKFLKWLVVKRKFTPFSFARFGGRLVTPKFLAGYMRRAMGDVPPEEFDILKDYLYQICLQKGSSEYSISIMFDDIIFAKEPIMDYIEELR